MDQRRQIWPRVGSQRREGLSSLRNQRVLGDDRLRKYMGIELLLGLGALPLRSLVLRRLLRMELDARLRVGTCMGILEKWRRLLRMGTHGSRRTHQRQHQPARKLLDVSAS